MEGEGTSLEGGAEALLEGDRTPRGPAGCEGFLGCSSENARGSAWGVLGNGTFKGTEVRLVLGNCGGGGGGGGDVDGDCVS